jgi:hypothetical protein
MFNNLVVPLLEERKNIVHVIHNEIGHFSEQQILIEVKKRYFWHNKTKLVRKVIRTCKRCQMVKETSSLHFGIKELKNISICDLSYRVVLDIASPLLEVKIWQ